LLAGSTTMLGPSSARRLPTPARQAQGLPQVSSAAFQARHRAAIERRWGLQRFFKPTRLAQCCPSLAGARLARDAWQAAGAPEERCWAAGWLRSGRVGGLGGRAPHCLPAHRCWVANQGPAGAAAERGEAAAVESTTSLQAQHMHLNRPCGRIGGAKNASVYSLTAASKSAACMRARRLLSRHVPRTVTTAESECSRRPAQAMARASAQRTGAAFSSQHA